MVTFGGNVSGTGLWEKLTGSILQDWSRADKWHLGNDRLQWYKMQSWAFVLTTWNLPFMYHWEFLQMYHLQEFSGGKSLDACIMRKKYISINIFLYIQKYYINIYFQYAPDKLEMQNFLMLNLFLKLRYLIMYHKCTGSEQLGLKFST